MTPDRAAAKASRSLIGRDDAINIAVSAGRLAAISRAITGSDQIEISFTTFAVRSEYFCHLAIHSRSAGAT